MQPDWCFITEVIDWFLWSTILTPGHTWFSCLSREKHTNYDLYEAHLIPFNTYLCTYTKNGKCGCITTTKRSWGFTAISSIFDDYRNSTKRGQPIRWKASKFLTTLWTLPLIPNANQLTYKDLEVRSARQFTKVHKRKHNEYFTC